MIETLRPAALSATGQLIAFESRTAIPATRYCCQRLYVLDRASGLLTQATHGADGTQPDGDSQAPSLSADGQVIAFETVAPNLHAGQYAARRGAESSERYAAITSRHARGASRMATVADRS